MKIIARNLVLVAGMLGLMISMRQPALAACTINGCENAENAGLTACTNTCTAAYPGNYAGCAEACFAAANQFNNFCNSI